MAFRIQLRRDLAARWSTNNPILLLGEFGYEMDTGYAKIGDGETHWNDLGYYSGPGSPVVIVSPNGTKYKITVDDAGNLSTTSI